MSAALIALLVFCQQVAFAHALTHLSNPSAPRPARGDTQHPAEKACAECALFSQLGTALSGAVPQIAVVVSSPVLPVEWFVAYTPEFVSAFHSRAPPLLLV